MEIIENEESKILLENLILSHCKDIYVVYGHYQPTDNKWYCGITKFYKTLNNNRWHSGHGYLGKKKSGNWQHPKFAPAILKYGWSSFQHYILGYYSIDEIDKAEKNWIKIKNSYHNGYNANSGGQRHKIQSKETREKLSKILKGKLTGKNNPMYGKPGTRLGTKMTEETKKKISEKNKNNPNLIHRGKDNPMSKSVIAIDIKSGKKLKCFVCADDAARFFNAINGSHISGCCKGTKYSAYGYKWEYNLKDIELISISDKEFLSYRQLGKPGNLGKKRGKYKTKKE